MIVDPEVEAVLQFMQDRFSATRLVPIAEAVSALAPVLWGRYGREAIAPLTITSVEQTPTASSQ